MIIMPEIDKRNASRVADRIRRAIEVWDFDVPAGQPIEITATFGLATCPEDGSSPEDLLLRADERLYRAKRAGKNRVLAV